MKEILSELSKGIMIRNEVLEEVKRQKETLLYLNGLDQNTMPPQVKRNHIAMIEEAKKIIEGSKESIVSFEEDFESDTVIKYVNGFPGAEDAARIISDIKCLEAITGSEELDITDGIKEELDKILVSRNDTLSELKEQAAAFISERISREFFDDNPAQNGAKESERIQQNRKRDYTPRKSSKSPKEIKELIEEFVEANEPIFNKIIFESKPPSISVTDRVLDVSYKPGAGYVISFISEPDTNYGKFYRNLLNVFSEIRDHMIDKHDVVTMPEESKNISYLNSFYQNYIFVREKIDTALTQYKLQNSLLNENFSVKYMIFEKISGKYLVFYNGNKGLSRAVESYFQNQARLGTMTFEPEFVEYSDSLKNIISERHSAIVNKIDLSSENNYMKISSPGSGRTRSVLLDITGVKILIDPEHDYKESDLDIVIMSNAREDHVELIPGIMSCNPNAKLFTSDLSFKMARVKWFRKLNNPNLTLNDSENYSFTRQDIDSLNERVIRITPEGKGYNYKSLVNIKFFNSGSIPGSAVVEIRDSQKKTLYLGKYADEDSGLMCASDIDLNEYDYLISKEDRDYPVEPLPVPLIKEKLSENKQVFIFSDSLGDLQHISEELYQAGINKPVIAGEATFTAINKELSKMLNFGSSWGDYFIDKELFEKSVAKIEPFSDEYEFYKKFSMSDSGVFILPFEKTEIDMVLKNKLYGGSLILVESGNEDEFVGMLQNDPLVPDEHKSGKHTTYNYIRSMSAENLKEITSKGKKHPLVINGTEYSDPKSIY